MTKHKRGEQGSSSSSPESPLELKKAKTTETMAEQDFEDRAIRDLIRHFNENMDNNFAKLHEELSYLRAEMKVELDKLNGKFKQLENSVENVWVTIDDMKEESAALKAVKSLHEKEIQSLQQELTNVSKDLVKTKAELIVKEEREKIIELEDYTRRENLKFNNIPDAREKDQNLTPKQVVCDIFQKEMNLDPRRFVFRQSTGLESKRKARIDPLLPGSSVETTEILSLAERRHFKRARGLKMLT